MYATVPVISLGRTLLQDLYASTPLASSIIPTNALTESAYSFPAALRDGKKLNILRQTPTSDEIASYFGLINPVKYSQPHEPLASPSSAQFGEVQITAYGAGHTLGGTIWHIESGVESVIYAVEWNQSTEHVLSGAAWLGSGAGGSGVLEQLRRPTAMICSSKGSGLVKVAQEGAERDEALLSKIRETVAKGGSVLIPSDSSARILELAYLLEETWQNEAHRADSPLKSAKIYLASTTAGATMRYARSMLEWMKEGIAKEFEAGAGGAPVDGQGRNRGGKGIDIGSGAPFDFRHITLLERKSRVSRMLGTNEPRVILASDTSLEWGFSMDAIRSLASDEKNLVILTERVGERCGQETNLGRYLWNLWAERTAPSSTVVDASGCQAPIRTVRAVALENDEIPLYQQYLATQRQLQNTMGGDVTTTQETSADVADGLSSTDSESSEESESGFQGKAMNSTAIQRHADRRAERQEQGLGVKILLESNGVFDYEVQGKKGIDRLFPFKSERKRADEFGDLIRPKEFARADEEENASGEVPRGDGTKKENAVGQKRQWDDLVNVLDSSKPKASQKRRKQDGDGDADSDSEQEDDVARVDGPSKVIVETESLELKCRISFVDFSGLHDRRTLQMVIPLIKPRKLIFVAGEEAETKELAEECRKMLNAGSTGAANVVDVFTPTVGMIIDASVDTNAWSVKLSRNMVRSLHWQRVGRLDVVAITGRLAAASLDPEPKEEDEGSAKKKAKTAKTVVVLSSQDKNDTTPILDVVPANNITAVRSVAQPFHVGDVRLADLRKIMKAQNMEAEFRGEGILVINGTVAVKKNNATGTIEIDGGAYSFADPTAFFKVKKKLYEGLAIVAGN